MKRPGLIAATVLLAAGANALAGELDSEYGKTTSKPKATAVDGAPKPTILRTAVASSELDGESPAQACCFRKRFCCGFGYGYGGFGYGGFGGYGGYGGFGGYGSYGGIGYCGFGFGGGYGGFGGGYGGYGGFGGYY